MPVEKKIVWKALCLILVLVLIIPVLAACDDDDDDETTQPATAQPTTTQSPAATSGVSDEPVKIGIIGPWTGPMAMVGPVSFDPAIKLVELWVEKKGGVDVGGVIHPLEIIKYDNADEIPKALTGVTKLVTQDKVSAICFGGVNDASQTATAEKCREDEMPLFTWNSAPEDPNEWRIAAGYPPSDRWGQTTVEYVLEKYHPETVSLLVDGGKSYRDRADNEIRLLEEAGVEIGSVQYIEYGTTDVSPYLTKIRREAPDVLIVEDSDLGLHTALVKEMPNLGGWGDTIFVTSEPTPLMLNPSTPGADGYAFWTVYVPGFDAPGATDYEALWDEAGLNRSLLGTVAPSYVVIRSAVEAVELAGSTDPVDVWNAARSGNLEWSSPYGEIKLNTNGEVEIPGFMGMIKDGEFIVAP